MNVVIRFVVLILMAGAAAFSAPSRLAFAQDTQEAVESPSENATVENAVSAAAQETPQAVQEADVQKFTMVFALTSAKASDLAVRVEEMLTKDVGKVKFDEASNKLVVTDSAAKIEEIRKWVDTVDQRDRQVAIDAKIIQISLNDEHRMGVDWEAIVSNYHSLGLAGKLGNPSDGEKRGKLSIGTIANDDYSVLVEALDTVGDVNVLSNHSITTINNKEVRISVGSPQPHAAAMATHSSDQSATAESVNFTDLGVKLFVTPTVQADGLITMKIRPEVSSVTGSNSTAPVVDTSEAETTVNAKDGVTIVIGGLIKEEKAKTIKKVPILGDVPLLGMAFRSYSHSIKKTEIVIFLVPKISTGDIAKPAAQNKPPETQ